jgi:sterol desaturase/sphingolipid hydroxylase (fatty acid hydroxylase superfamily)|tara:strand:- start:1920 stop:2162 length:243 start_codon:yes stop_codon:yes gene_type:complete
VRAPNLLTDPVFLFLFFYSSALSFHPVEGLVFFSAYLIVLFLPNMPIEMWYGFKIGMVLGPIHAHLGYDLGSVVQGPAHQ